jgi:hypothetical protein
MWDSTKDANDCYLYASAVSEGTEVAVKSPLGKAVIAVGRNPSDDSWERFLKLGNRAYEIFSNLGLSEDKIRFPESPSSEDASPSYKQVLEDSILNWGKTGLSSNQILYIYLVSDNNKGHGFILSIGESGTELLSTAEVHQWLEQLTLEGVNVIFMMDSCYSGEYIQGTQQPLNPPLRAVITSTDAENIALITSDMSFSNLFFDQLDTGSDLKNAFLGTVKSMATADYPNKPQIDTNGDAVYWSGAETELDPLEGLYLGTYGYGTARTVPVPGDLNSDGVINVLDVVMVASCIGTNDLVGDVNNDGKVDMEDLELVFQNYEENRE